MAGRAGQVGGQEMSASVGRNGNIPARPPAAIKNSLSADFTDLRRFLALRSVLQARKNLKSFPDQSIRAA